MQEKETLVRQAVQADDAPAPAQNPLIEAADKAARLMEEPKAEVPAGGLGGGEYEEDFEEEESGGLRGLLGRLFGRGRRAVDEEREEEESEAGEQKSREELEEEARKAAALAAAEAENRLDVGDSRLYDICVRQLGITPPADAEGKYSLRFFMDEHTLPTEEQRLWLLSMESAARGMAQYAPPLPAAPVAEEGEDVPPPPPPQQADAKGIVKVAGNGMQAYLFILPPTEDGNELGAERAKALLKAEGVVFGIDEEALEEMCSRGRYMTLVKVAEGVPAQDGVDGKIVEHYARELEIHLTVKDDNTIDYKDLRWLQTILQGEVVCDIVPPTPGQHGTNVRGKEVRAKDGRKPPVPGGSGTKKNEDGTALVAAMDGVVSFEQDRFRVDPLLIVQGNVETATGNLDVVGDILVHGDIQEGFEVKATGNITVQGMVEGAVVEAGGNVQVGRGMNGNAQGRLVAKGNVLCKYIENANVEAGGKIVCDTIINSEVSSDDSIQVTTGRGTIVGGSVTALNDIFAREVGNQSNRAMAVTLGSTRHYLDEKRELEEKMTYMIKQIDAKEKNIAFLSNSAILQPEEASLLEELQQGLRAQKMQQANLKRRIGLMQARLNDVTACRLKAEVIYPPVDLTIGSTVKRLRNTLFNAVVFWKEDEIHEVTL